MLKSVDLYLGSFLILCGFALSLLNLRRIVKESNAAFPAVLLSENILLTCIGIAFISRSAYELSSTNVEMNNMVERSADIMKLEEIDCNFTSILMSYGPLIVSLVNSFLSLIIDNYMHYKLVADVKKNEDESAVQELSETFRIETRSTIKSLVSFWKKYFSFITVAIQWILPVLITLSMYSMEVKVNNIFMSDIRGLSDSCMALLDVSKTNCSTIINMNDTLQLRTYMPNYSSPNYFEMYENYPNNSGEKVDTIVNNVYKIIASLQNETLYADFNVTSAPLFRTPKADLSENCMKICYIDNQKLLLFMFAITIVSFFVPITISTVILTKIHMMDLKKQNVKTYVSRELLYNILFWSPVMLDTFLSLTVCSYNMKGMRTSIFNIIANVYQAIKNFMNTKYFKDNTVSPI